MFDPRAKKSSRKPKKDSKSSSSRGQARDTEPAWGEYDPNSGNYLNENYSNVDHGGWPNIEEVDASRYSSSHPRRVPVDVPVDDLANEVGDIQLEDKTPSSEKRPRGFSHSSDIDPNAADDKDYTYTRREASVADAGYELAEDEQPPFYRAEQDIGDDDAGYPRQSRSRSKPTEGSSRKSKEKAVKVDEEEDLEESEETAAHSRFYPAQNPDGRWNYGDPWPQPSQYGEKSDRRKGKGRSKDTDDNSRTRYKDYDQEGQQQAEPEDEEQLDDPDAYEPAKASYDPEEEEQLAPEEYPRRSEKQSRKGKGVDDSRHRSQHPSAYGYGDQQAEAGPADDDSNVEPGPNPYQGYRNQPQGFPSDVPARREPVDGWNRGRGGDVEDRGDLSPPESTGSDPHDRERNQDRDRDRDRDRTRRGRGKKVEFSIPEPAVPEPEEAQDYEALPEDEAGQSNANLEDVDTDFEEAMAAEGYDRSHVPEEDAESAYGKHPQPYEASETVDDEHVDDPRDNHIKGTPGKEEALDPRYKIHKSHKFAPSTVFKVLWYEPTGSSVPGGTISEKEKVSRFGQSYYVGFRRFIVVANDEGHCTCVPILTYKGKGCKKKGVKPRTHGMVFDASKPRPKLLKEEPELGFKPVSMRMTVKGEDLVKESRVNYSKFVTVEHNVKVFFIGHITKDSYATVRYAVGKCWDMKAQDYPPNQY